MLERTAPGIATLWDYKITEPKEFVGASPAALAKLSAARLTREGGCEVVWQRVDAELFKGSTGAAHGCKSELRGATHVISYSELTPHKWGPPPGVIGHIFRKRVATAAAALP